MHCYDLPAHQTVLKQAAVEGLVTDPNGLYFDCTFGRGGHTEEILKRLGEKARLIALDRDIEAIEYGRRRFACDERVEIKHMPFSKWQDCIDSPGSVDGVLFDLGVSSPQLDEAERGFSFMRDGPLDMRMDTSSGITAQQWLADVDEAELVQVLREFGEESFARRIARAICESRIERPIDTTARLAEIVASSVPLRDRKKHPATKTFQAIRIKLNAELDEVRMALSGVDEVLKPGGRLVVISFHSLEDRIVKRFMRDQSRPAPIPKHIPITAHEPVKLRVLGKAVRPDEEEVKGNPRARSAVMRVAERRG